MSNQDNNKVIVEVVESAREKANKTMENFDT